MRDNDDDDGDGGDGDDEVKVIRPSGLMMRASALPLRRNQKDRSSKLLNSFRMLPLGIYNSKKWLIGWLARWLVLDHLTGFIKGAIKVLESRIGAVPFAFPPMRIGAELPSSARAPAPAPPRANCRRKNIPCRQPPTIGGSSENIWTN